jgi:polyisoprenyl-phosphate glycosyltransferase
MTVSPKVSVAIPIFNEESVLPELYRRTAGVLSDLPGGPHEMVFVDDGSRDGTLELLEAIASIDPRVTVLALSRNFGHQAALTAALDHVSGDVVVVMDGDLQDTPETIPQFLAAYHQGYDVVYAIRQNRKEGWLLRACYATFYRLISKLADIRLPVGSGDFALMSRRVVNQLKKSTERHRYLRGLRAWVGFPQIGIQVERAARHSGESKYNFRRLLRLAFDGIFSFSVVPIRAATALGALTVGGSLAFAGYSLFARLLLQQSPAGFTALILAITFLAGVQLLFLGVIGEYVGRIYEEVKSRPHYIVDRVLRLETTEVSASRLEATSSRVANAHPAREPLIGASHG